MAQRHFSFVKKRDCYVVYFGKNKVGTITNRGYKILFGDGSSVPLLPNIVVKDQKKKSAKASADSDEIVAACQLAKAYNNAKIAFYKNKHVTKITEESPDFKHFIKAARFVTTHEVTNKAFMAAQISGLKFANGGKGAFPKPVQLSTSEAETRLLEFQRKDVNEEGEEVDVVLSFKEKAMSLSENGKYQSLFRKLENAEATMWEAIYVKKCQLARRGKVSETVESYIEFLKDEAMNKNGDEG